MIYTTDINHLFNIHLFIYVYYVNTHELIIDGTLTQSGLLFTTPTWTTDPPTPNGYLNISQGIKKNISHCSPQFLFYQLHSHNKLNKISTLVL